VKVLPLILSNFEQEQAFPLKQVTYLQGLLQGLPLASQDYTYAQPSQLEQMVGGSYGVQKLYNDLFGGAGSAVGSAVGSGISSIFGDVGDFIGGLFD
jgi:hypothetical protein